MTASPPTERISRAQLADLLLNFPHECCGSTGNRQADDCPVCMAVQWLEQPAEPDGGQAPIVRVRVEQRGTTVASGGKLPHYMIVHQSMYAPGLPSGEHDLYCAPVPAGDLTWRDEIQFECAHAMEKGDYRGAVLSIYGLMQRACPALTKAGSES